jgi:hypothetical protein
MSHHAERFDRFAARKTAAALAARLTPLATEVEQPDADLESVGNAWTRALFGGPWYMSPPPSADLPSTSLVFVQSRDANTGADDPSALGGGATDKHLIYEGLSRVAVDAVLAGAETVRGSVVLVTVPGCTNLTATELASRPWITPIVMAQPEDLPLAWRRLREMGVARVSCIGGRTLARQLIDAKLIQDLYLTTSPIEGGTPHTPLYPEPLVGRTILRKRGTGAEVGVRFEHMRWQGPVNADARPGSRIVSARVFP